MHTLPLIWSHHILGGRFLAIPTAGRFPPPARHEEEEDVSANTCPDPPSPKSRLHPLSGPIKPASSQKPRPLPPASSCFSDIIKSVSCYHQLPPNISTTAFSKCFRYWACMLDWLVKVELLTLTLTVSSRFERSEEMLIMSLLANAHLIHFKIPLSFCIVSCRHMGPKICSFMLIGK